MQGGGGEGSQIGPLMALAWLPMLAHQHHGRTMHARSRSLRCQSVELVTPCWWLGLPLKLIICCWCLVQLLSARMCTISTVCPRLTGSKLTTNVLRSSVSTALVPGI